MKRQKRFIPIVTLTALVLTAMVFSSCMFFNFGNQTSKKEMLQDYQDMYQQELLDHFAANEDIFNRVAATIMAYIAGAEDFESYNRISISFGDEENDFIFFTARQPDRDDEEVLRESIILVDDDAINIYGLTREELGKVLEGDGFERKTGLPRYTSAFVSSWLHRENTGDFVDFPFYWEGLYNRADRVEAALYYSGSGIARENTVKINDHWFIEYTFYLAPL